MNHDDLLRNSLTIRSSIASGVALIGVTTAAWMLATTPNKALWASLGFGSAVGGMLAISNAEAMLDVRGTVYDVSRQVRANLLYQHMMSGCDNNTTAQYFDWELLKTKPDTYPHLLLLGGTGDGKSTLAENLAHIIGGTTYAIAPHWQAGDFPGCYHIATARNLGTGIDGDACSRKPLYYWTDLCGATDISATDFLHALYWEMVRRYQLDQLGQFVGSRDNVITVVCDEFLSYAKLPGVRQLWTKLVREARKVNIRLILLVQGDGVASLGIEGEGDIRENLTYVYLGKFATEHAQMCYNRASKAERPKYQWILANLDQRPCMVESQAALLPKPRPKTYEPTNATPTKQPVPPDSARAQPMALSSEPIPTASAPDTQPQAGYVPSGHRELELVGSLDPEALSQYLKDLWQQASDAARGQMPSGRFATKEYIIKQVWGFQSSNYHTGKMLWALTTRDYGPIKLKEDV